MPRQDCFEIDYSLGRAARFPKGLAVLGQKKEKENDSATKQILAKSNFLLQLPDESRVSVRRCEAQTLTLVGHTKCKSTFV